MSSVREELDRLRREPKSRSGNGRKKRVSGKGGGKWQTLSTLARYRVTRNRARKVALASRRRNRQ